MQSRQASTADKIIVDRTKRQSAATKMVRDARRLLSSNSSHPLEYEVERWRSYAENHYNARIALPLLVLTVALVSSLWVDPIVVIYWILLALCGYGFMLAVSHRFRKEEPSEENLPGWRKRFRGAQILVAVAWTGFAYYHCESCNIDETFLIIQFSAILVFQALTMILSYGFGTALLLTSAPPTIVLALRLSMHYEPATFVMGSILVGSQVFFYLIADRFRLSALSALSHSAEREELIAELETAKSISEEARRRAEAANMAKSRFLATMSHELRTPLNAILGFSEVMKGEVLGPMGNDSYREYVSDIHASGSHLLNVINEILDLSRIEAGRQELQEEAIKLAYVVDDARHMVDMKAKTKGVAIVTQYEENMPQIWADEKAVRQIALNLLSNALKFTPGGGTITVTVGWTTKGGQYLSIRDTGPGIPEEEIPVVLSSFGQGSIAIKSAEQGTGLGLPIVQALMHMHDGKFELKSKLRMGTEVIATFPRSRVLEVMERTENTGREGRRRVPMMRRAS